jgi:hypothetical protein
MKIVLCEISRTSGASFLLRTLRHTQFSDDAVQQSCPKLRCGKKFEMLSDYVARIDRREISSPRMLLPRYTRSRSIVYLVHTRKLACASSIAHSKLLVSMSRGDKAARRSRRFRAHVYRREKKSTRCRAGKVRKPTAGSLVALIEAAVNDAYGASFRYYSFFVIVAGGGSLCSESSTEPYRGGGWGNSPTGGIPANGLSAWIPRIEKQIAPHCRAEDASLPSIRSTDRHASPPDRAQTFRQSVRHAEGPQYRRWPQPRERF